MNANATYPPGGAVFLIAESVEDVRRYRANIADLIDELVKRDARLAQLEAENAELKAKLAAPEKSRPKRKGRPKLALAPLVEAAVG